MSSPHPQEIARWADQLDAIGTPEGAAFLRTLLPLEIVRLNLDGDWLIGGRRYHRNTAAFAAAMYTLAGYVLDVHAWSDSKTPGTVLQTSITVAEQRHASRWGLDTLAQVLLRFSVRSNVLVYQPTRDDPPVNVDLSVERGQLEVS